MARTKQSVRAQQPPPPSTDFSYMLRGAHDWARDLGVALSDPETYPRRHNTLANDGESWSKSLRRACYGGVTIFSHVQKIMDDSTMRGYEHDIHYTPLIQAYTRYAQGEPPDPWVAPPIEFDDDTPPPPEPPASHSPPPPPTPKPLPPAKPDHKGKSVAAPKAPPPPKPAAAPSKSKKIVKSSSVVADSSDGVEAATVIVSKPAPRYAFHHPKCLRCQKSGTPCQIRPASTSKAFQACRTCHDAKMKCTFPQVEGHEEEEEEEEDSKRNPKPLEKAAERASAKTPAVVVAQKKRGAARKRPTAVARSAAGQYAGMISCSTCLLD